MEAVAEDVQEHPCYVLRVDLDRGDTFAEIPLQRDVETLIPRVRTVVATEKSYPTWRKCMNGLPSRWSDQLLEAARRISSDCSDRMLLAKPRGGHPASGAAMARLDQCTANPTADWIARRIAEAFPWDQAPRYLIRDRDTAYGVTVHAGCEP